MAAARQRRNEGEVEKDIGGDMAGDTVSKPEEVSSQWKRYIPEGTADCGEPTLDQVQPLKGLQHVEGP